MEEEAAYMLFTPDGAKHRKIESITVVFQINYIELDMEVDTGAAISIISMATYCRLWQKHLAPPLPPTNKRLIPTQLRHWRYKELLQF